MFFLVEGLPKPMLRDVVRKSEHPSKELRFWDEGGEVGGDIMKQVRFGACCLSLVVCCRYKVGVFGGVPVFSELA